MQKKRQETSGWQEQDVQKHVVGREGITEAIKSTERRLDEIHPMEYHNGYSVIAIQGYC